MANITPVQRTLKYFRSKGWVCEKVERWNPYAGKRQDVFGFIDVMAILPECICGIQACGQAFSAHDKKIRASGKARKWVEAGQKVILCGWRKVKKKRGGKMYIWRPRIKEYTLEDFEDEI